VEPISLLTCAVAYVSAAIVKKCSNSVVSQAYEVLKGLLKSKLGHDPEPEDLTPETIQKLHLDASDKFVEQAKVVIEQSSALRRARLVKSVVDGAHILWVDDKPRDNIYERRTLEALGITIEEATSTGLALAKAKARHTNYDLILSDMVRSRPDSGLVLLNSLRDAGCTTEVVFYVRKLDKKKSVPLKAFGITNQPEALLHYVLDVLERQRAPR
jgi:CheY-like chemotaxis protein